MFYQMDGARAVLSGILSATAFIIVIYCGVWLHCDDSKHFSFKHIIYIIYCLSIMQC